MLNYFLLKLGLLKDAFPVQLDFQKIMQLCLYYIIFLLMHLPGEYVLHFRVVLEIVAARQRNSGYILLLSND